jgi:3-hydroxyisobutyrate dehydrogenase-like beta-hydroxyacid dehydrogenase
MCEVWHASCPLSRVLIVGIVGMGHMGSRIAERLRQAGHEVRTGEPAELAAQVDVLFTVLPDDSDVREVVLDTGLLAQLRDGAVFADLSTTSIELAEELGAAGREAGADVLDIKMSGSTPQVESGTLILLVGGDADVLERIRPVLEPLSQSIHLLGPNGAGAKMKLAVNLMLGVEMQAVAEAIAFAETVGLERGVVLETLEQMAVVAPAHKGKIDNARKGIYPVAFPLRLMSKDLSLIHETAAKAGLELPATEAASRVFATELAQADKDEDFSAVIRLMERNAEAANG